MEGDRLRVVAATCRVVLGLLALAVLPLFRPGLGADRFVFVAYLAAVSLGPGLLTRLGSDRLVGPTVFGLLDIGATLFLAHRLGSISTMVPSIFVFAAVIYTLVYGRRVGLVFASMSGLGYAVLVTAEAGLALPYAPASLNRPPAPTDGEAAAAALLLAALSVATATVVGVLEEVKRSREAELLEANAKLAELSIRDPLTQLYNRRHLLERLEAELARLRRGHALSVVMIDLDHFKQVNDTNGHQQGDAVLSAIAQALVDETRETDVPARYGGDEFVVILPDTDAASAEVVAQRLVDAVRAVGERLSPNHPVTASIGVALGQPEDDASSLVQRADEHSFRAKERGGDQTSLEAAPPPEAAVTSHVRFG